MHSHADIILLQTVTVALFAAIALQILADRLKVPAIALLLVAGVLLGPEVLDVVRPETLGSGFKAVIGLAVAIILFEGGLTLSFDGLRSCPSVIRRMLTLGVVVTLAGATLAIYVFFDLGFKVSLLAASLIVVTGPTVIGPLLRRTRVVDRLHAILHWEGVIIDPIGVFIALFCFEVALLETLSLEPIAVLALRTAIGLGLGLATGWLLATVLKRGWIAESFHNMFVLTSVLLAFGIADQLSAESGILVVTVAGLYLGQQHVHSIKEIKRFKLEVTELAIGVLFILLAARLDIGRFIDLGWGGVGALAAIIFLVRPLSVLLSSWGSDLPRSERMFLAWLAPRGIVAASMASLFALYLGEYEAYADQAWFLETFTYAVIGSTVLLQGPTAGLWARFLGVQKPPRRAWLIIGAHPLAKLIARRLQSAGAEVILVDVNPENVRRAQQQGLRALRRDALDTELREDPELRDVGHVIAMTGNSALDELACSRWDDVVGRDRVYRLARVLGATPESETGEATRHGVAIWLPAGPVNHLENEVELGLAHVLEAGEVLHDRPGIVYLPLFSVLNGNVTIHVDPTKANLDPNARHIYLERNMSGLAGIVREVVDLDPGELDAEGVYRALLETSASYQADLDIDAVLTGLLARERTMSSYLGHGVAIPHAYVEGLSTPICIGARLTGDGRDALRTGDGDEVRLVFLLLSPAGRAETHLRVLGELARLVADEESLSAILAANSVNHVVQIIRQFGLPTT